MLGWHRLNSLGTTATVELPAPAACLELAAGASPLRPQGDSKRFLLAALTKSLDQILPFLEQTMERNFAAAGAATQAGGAPAAAAHVAAIQAALQAVRTYAEWAPVGRLKDAGLVNACGYLLGTAEFREGGCEALRVLATRKQEDGSEEFRGAVEQVADALMGAAAALLTPGAAAQLGYEGLNDEFGQALCDTMTALGSAHFAAITSPDKRTAFMQHMLAFTQHPYLLLADKALPFWAKLLQDAAASAAHAAAAAPAPKAATIPLPPEAVAALMELAADQLQARGPHTPQEEEEVPPYFDTFLVSSAGVGGQVVGYLPGSWVGWWWGGGCLPGELGGWGGVGWGGRRLMYQEGPEGRPLRSE